jgi:hypothetical protein
MTVPSINHTFGSSWGLVLLSNLCIFITIP